MSESDIEAEIASSVATFDQALNRAILVAMPPLCEAIIAAQRADYAARLNGDARQREFEYQARVHVAAVGVE